MGTDVVQVRIKTAGKVQVAWAESFDIHRVEDEVVADSDRPILWNLCARLVEDVGERGVAAKKVERAVTLSLGDGAQAGGDGGVVQDLDLASFDVDVVRLLIRLQNQLERSV
jgi:hypothetical protein